jgi:predicted helicase
VRHDPKLSGSAYNVFGIQVGVGITLAVRSSARKTRAILFHEVPIDWRRQDKLSWLSQQRCPSAIPWRSLTPTADNSWLARQDAAQFASLVPLGRKRGQSSHSPLPDTVFSSYSNGIKTNADVYVCGFQKACLQVRAKEIVDDFNDALDRWKRHDAPSDLQKILRVKESVHKWIRKTRKTLLRGESQECHESDIRLSLYRPFTTVHHFFKRAFNEDLYQLPRLLPSADSENHLLCVSAAASERPFFSLITNRIPNLSMVGFGGACQCFAFYVYDEDGSNRRENITDWALKLFREHYADKKITKQDIFHYVYGILHHKGYREKFADNLKRDLPRIPLASSRDDFRAFAGAGKALAKLHLDYESLDPWPLQWIETPGEPLSYRVDKMKLSKDKRTLVVNDSLALEGIPPEVFDYRLGNRSALDWIVDQYQVSTDKRSGITSDPNRPDDPEYIVRLVAQVVRVSVETVKLVNALPPDFGGPP